MPVPVPRQLKASAHPVIKPAGQSGDRGHPQLSVFHNLTHTLPLPPPGPPPSFGTREEWISSLPSWRRNKPRRIWEEDDTHVAEAQDFHRGLADADNAPVIKGERAQACIPPALTLMAEPVPASLPRCQQPFECEEDADDEMSFSIDCDIESQWSGHSPDTREGVGMEAEPSHGTGSFQFSGSVNDYDMYDEDQQMYERGAFTPVFEEPSPELAVADGDPASSPIGPMTPFGDFVDRVVATAQTCGNVQAHTSQVPGFYVNSALYGQGSDVRQRSPPQQYRDFDQVSQADPAPAFDSCGAPSSTTSYKKLADPLSEWVASYIWKACTTGMSLPDFYAPSSPAPRQYSSAPPSYLANSIRSLLMSTLLQPSAILLAVWYIIRLPVSFAPVGLGPECVKELRFRAELLGLDEWQGGADREAIERHAPFRLVLLGCMLANKWLDDHTFSNKTWHTISGVPIQSLNRLEYLALDMFSHQLSVPAHIWNQWLEHLLSYHMTLSSSRPQPISRPSSNPHSVVRKAIEELIEVSNTSNTPPACNDRCASKPAPQPVFLGLEERQRQRMGRSSFETSADGLEIDLDEDGPLREEYMPRRRVSRGGSVRDAQGDGSGNYPQQKSCDWERMAAADRMLPPPAKWSPAADEPIMRDGGRAQGQYVAVRPLMLPPPAPLLAPLQSFSAMPNGGYAGWNAGGGFFPPPSMKYQLPPISALPIAYDYGQSAHHSRSASLSVDHQSVPQQIGHGRAHSQTHFEYACSDLRMTSQKMPPQLSHPEPRWTGADQYRYGPVYGPQLGHDSGLQYQPAWIRA
ncbi:hypothetical protein EWM64_g3260 [Hericium alpestre]|uniref:Cyclin N-terminal domain-containing protein n=1 Tax=Hericium alpestre TaxID=135208 RepID=A0A4Z0A0Z5_9AGAM|nr:hypothetical protein EWM64_g3260 [Hericium alpestre]